LILILLIAICFCFQSFYWFIYFSSIPSLSICFSLNCLVMFGSNSFNCYFLIIFLINLFFFHFFIDLLSSISSLNICLVKNFIFSGFLSTGSPRSHDPNHKSKRLARVDFGPFLMHFFKIFFIGICFCYSIYEVISISCSRSCIWFVHPSRLSSSLEDCFICFHNIDRCPFFIFF
jgi:hypothetical protein